MIDKIDIRPPVFDRRFDFNQEELTPLEMVGRVAQTLNVIIDIVNGWQGSLDAHELSDNITQNRKLSPTGNFTGSLMGKTVNSVINELGSNKDKVLYLAQQFAVGQTGAVIDGGFFQDTNIKRNFDGGMF